jgi:hypothetical protein
LGIAVTGSSRRTSLGETNSADVLFVNPRQLERRGTSFEDLAVDVPWRPLR